MKTTYHKKMAPKCKGPFEIKEVIGPVTYQLKLPDTAPPPDIIDGEEVYQIETILKHRKRGHGYQYLIKWEKYPILEASWELEGLFSEDGDLLELYKK